MWAECAVSAPAAFIVAIALLAPGLCSASSADDETAAPDMYCGAGNCYDILGIVRGVDDTISDVKRTYRKLARLLHPDVFNPGAILEAQHDLKALQRASSLPQTKEEATSLFRDIATAYEVLSDVQRRDAYDYYLLHPEQHLYNQYAYFRATYKTDVRYVILGILCAWAALEMWYKRQRHHDRVASLLKDPAFIALVRKRMQELEVNPPSSAATLRNRSKTKHSAKSNTG